MVEQANRLSDKLSLARNRRSTTETKHMQPTLWNLYSRLWNLMLREEGQDLIEYAFVVAGIALAATAGMQAAAGGVNGVFIAIGATFSSAIR
jgi:pilus assembly protein Flp/PilA